MTNHDELRKLADAAIAAKGVFNRTRRVSDARVEDDTREAFQDAASPDVVIGLLDEIAELKRCCEEAEAAIDSASKERDALKARVDAIREQFPSGIYEGDPLTPIAAVLDCPFLESGHYWKDGCPACYANEQKAVPRG